MTIFHPVGNPLDLPTRFTHTLLSHLQAGEIQVYIEKVARHFGVMSSIRFGHRVEGATYDEATAQVRRTIGIEGRRLSARKAR